MGSSEIKLTPPASSRTFIAVLKERSKLGTTTSMEQQQQQQCRTGTQNGVASKVSGQREEDA